VNAIQYGASLNLAPVANDGHLSLTGAPFPSRREAVRRLVETRAESKAKGLKTYPVLGRFSPFGPQEI